MRIRSILTVAAGASPDEAALTSEADALLFNVADASVPAHDARRAAREGIEQAAGHSKVAFVRVNHPRTHMLRDDLDALVSPVLAGVFVTHTVNPQDIRDTAVILREVELRNEIEPGSVGVFPVVDTARGLLRAAELVDAAPRVRGLLLDADTYARDVGARPEENGPRLAYARGKAVAVARAYDRLPLVVSSGLEMRFLAQHGFAGAVIDHPRYAPSANTVFTPGMGAKKRAEQHRDAYEAARAEGAWIARVGSEIADAHSARKAAQTLGVSDER